MAPRIPLRRAAAPLFAAMVLAHAGHVLSLGADGASAPGPLSIGSTFTLDSAILGETRRINVYAPPAYAGSNADSATLRLPVLYMPDGGLAEDFLHIAGLVQVSVGNGTMRPFLLVGIENTERRRDLTGPTTDPRDLAIAPRVGGSFAFRAFLRDELMPHIDNAWRTTGETAIVGESAAGLFAVESFLLEPGLFDTAIAIDPSLWWDHESLTTGAAARLAALPGFEGTLWLAGSDAEGNGSVVGRMAEALKASAPTGLRCVYVPMPEETHATIYHPAAVRAFREVLGPR